MKKLKDTKLGQWLKDKAPQVLDVVGDILPDKGVLGMVKNLIDKGDLPPEIRAELETKWMEFEKEIFELEIQDRASARSREVEFVKATGHIDFLMWFLAVAGVGIFAYMVYMIMNGSVPEQNRELIFHIFGLVEGAMLVNIYNYYFGSSAGSRIKDMKAK
jgi:hypothetical protein